MPKILVSGSSGYIGTSFRQWLSRIPDAPHVDTISLRDEHWRGMSFSGYDALIHAAAIVHRSGLTAEDYYKVNRDLTVAVAQKAKAEGVPHFVFISTMAVYGMNEGHITPDTLPAPKSDYAKSKYAAEVELAALECETFTISIIRPPLVYGPHCPGNYMSLSRLARLVPLFPDVPNVRSMIYIDNLSEFMRMIVSQRIGGPLFPQNSQYVNTGHMAVLVAEASGKKLFLSKMLGRAISPAIRCSLVLRKVFGSLTYDQSMSSVHSADGRTLSYETVSFESSVKASERHG